MPRPSAGALERMRTRRWRNAMGPRPGFLIPSSTSASQRAGPSRADVENCERRSTQSKPPPSLRMYSKTLRWRSPTTTPTTPPVNRTASTPSRGHGRARGGLPDPLPARPSLRRGLLPYPHVRSRSAVCSLLVIRASTFRIRRIAHTRGGLPWRPWLCLPQGEEQELADLSVADDWVQLRAGVAGQKDRSSGAVCEVVAEHRCE